MEHGEKVEKLDKYLIENKISDDCFSKESGAPIQNKRLFCKRCSGSKKYFEFWRLMEKYTGLDFDSGSHIVHSNVKLPSYVVVQLKVQGNTNIPKMLLKRYGKVKILEYLENEGLHCELEVNLEGTVLIEVV